MHFILLLAIAFLHPDSENVFSVQAELQGLYEQISQARLQFVTADDIDQFHEVLYAPEWVFIDAMGQRHPWSQIREEEIQALKAPTFDWMTQSIQKLSLWKLHSREQLGRAKVSVAASQYEKYLRDYAVGR